MCQQVFLCFKVDGGRCEVVQYDAFVSFVGYFGMCRDDILVSICGEDELDFQCGLAVSEEDFGLVYGGLYGLA